MNGLEILIYIILIVFYLLSRVLGGAKKNQQQREGQQDEYNKEPAQNTQSSGDFENTINELFGREDKHYNKASSEGREQPPLEESGGIRLETEEDVEEERDYRPQYFSGNYQEPSNQQQDQEKLKELQEKIRRARQKNKEKPSSDRRVPRIKTQMSKQQQRDEDYRLKQYHSPAQTYRRYFKSPQNLRQAFVLKEILDRKF